MQAAGIGIPAACVFDEWQNDKKNGTKVNS